MRVAAVGEREAASLGLGPQELPLLLPLSLAFGIYPSNASERASCSSHVAMIPLKRERRRPP